MDVGHRKNVALWILSTIWLSATEVWAGPSSQDAARKAIRDLDVAAQFEEVRAQGRCEGEAQGEPDLEAETFALSAAYIHIARFDRAKEINISATELIPVVIQAVDNFRLAYRCNPGVVQHIDTAASLVQSVRAMLPEGASAERDGIDQVLTELSALRENHPILNPLRQTPSRPVVRIMSLDPGTVSINTPLRNSYLERLSLRLESGFGAANLAVDKDDKARRHTGAYLRTHLLARYPASERRKVWLLFGAYYGVLFGTERPSIKPSLGNVRMHDIGAHFELQLTASDPWLSVHPFLNVGMEYVKRLSDVDDASGFQGGGGVLICVWHGSFCPTFRVLSVPHTEAKNRPTVQVGIAVDLLRLVDVGLGRRRMAQ